KRWRSLAALPARKQTSREQEAARGPERRAAGDVDDEMVAEEDAGEPGRERAEVKNRCRRREGVAEHGSDGKRRRRVARREAVGKDAVARPRMGKGELEPIRQDPRDDDRQEHDQARTERAAVSR